MSKWGTVIGLLLTAVGVVIGLYPPTIAARWSGSELLAQEHWLQVRYWVSVSLILFGTGLQVYTAWPRTQDKKRPPN